MFGMILIIMAAPILITTDNYQGRIKRRGHATIKNGQGRALKTGDG